MRTWRIVVGVWLGALALTTAIRCGVWQSDAALWADARHKAPTKPRPVMNDGRVHELAGDEAYAERCYREVIWLTWDDRRSAYVRRYSVAAAETNLAHLLMKKGQLASAMHVLDQTLEGWPSFPYAHYNKAAILWAIGACNDAELEYQIAMAGDPQLPPPKTPCEPSLSTP